MSVEQVWDELRSAALLGTDRRPWTAANQDHSLGTVLAASAAPGSSAEEVLLGAAAVVDAVRQAGLTPTRHGSADLQDEAGSAVETTCTPEAARLLAVLMSNTVATGGRGDQLLEEWLVACSAARQMVPAAQLVTLLDRATRIADLRPAVARVVGHRGHWLARRNGEWSWVLEEPEAEPPAHRLWLDRAAQPDRFDEVLAWWRTQPAAERAALILGLGEVAAATDEPLLEAALDDRARAVREAAATVLVRIDGSAFAGRMQQRVETVVSVARRPLGRRLEFGLPDEALADPAWARDGLAVPGTAATGPRAAMLVSLATRAPLTTWERASGSGPAALVAASRNSDVAAELRTGWLAACVAQHRSDWAEALVAELGEWSAVGAMTPEAIELHLLRQLASRQDVALLLRLLFATSPRWTTPVAVAIYERLRGGDALPVLDYDELAGRLLDLLDDDQVSWLLGGFDADDPRGRRLRHAHAARSLRRAIHKEFS